MKIKREDIADYVSFTSKIKWTEACTPAEWHQYIDKQSKIGRRVADICKAAIQIKQDVDEGVLCDILRMLGVEVE